METPLTSPRNLWVNFDGALAAIQEERGNGVRVAVVDSGIECGHPDFADLKLRDDVQVIQDHLQVYAGPGDGTDLNGHGTAIASIIHRIAPAAELGSFRVLDAATISRTEIVREGVRQALERGYNIINCSFGCGLADHLAKYKTWVDEAYLKGVHIVSACNNEDYNVPEWPGYFPSVITVNFCRGNSDGVYYRSGHLVEFYAEAADVDVAWKGGRRKKLTGSSFAAPHVAGLLARLLSRFPGLPPLQAKALLHELARPWRPEIVFTNMDLQAAEPESSV
jgi:subtilisin family serine protease